MFRHFSVGKKMAIGFGAEILLLLLSAVLIVTSGVSRIAALGELRHLASLQGAISTELKIFHDAQMLADTVIVEINDGAYAAYIEQIGAALETQENMERLARAAASPLLEDIGALKDLLGEWESHVSSVQRFNVSLERQTAEIEAVTAGMSDNAKAFFDALLAGAAGSEQLAVAALAMQQVEHIRLESASALYLFETKDITPVLEQIDAVAALLERGGQGDLPPGAVAPRRALQDGLAQYRKSFAAFAADSEESVVRHETPAYALAGELSALTVSLSDQVEASLLALMEKTADQYRASLIITLVLTVAGVVFGCIVAGRITHMLAAPLRRMHRLLTRMGEKGDLGLSDREMEEVLADAAVQDEVGQSIAAFWKSLQRQKEVCGTLERVAAGDLTVQIAPLSPGDAVGHSLGRMIDTLGHLLGELRVSADAVASGAVSLAGGAQTLAQNNAEQASSVEELNAAIADAASHAQKSADTARQAVQRSEAVRAAAKEGKAKMDDTVQAVLDINAAGESIKKIIDTIDHIAYQTNLLALNAAVEAARAGPEGRGFAVVAGEVRSLAARSAQAARDTGELISRSLELVQQGIASSQKTSDAFAEIIKTIRRSNEDMETIAQIIEVQTASFSQIDVGIGQIAKAIQNNSSTSEQTAVASEEMSGQADLLYQQIGRFRLKEGRHAEPEEGRRAEAAPGKKLFPGLARS